MSFWLYSIGISFAFYLLSKNRYAYNMWKNIMTEINYNGMALLSSVADNMNRSKNRIEEYPSKKGEVAIVTGGSRGIGVHIVKGLAKCGMHVVIAVRDPSAGEKIAKQIKDENLPGTTSVIQLDLSSMKSVENFSKEFKSKHPALHLLVNNAGTLFGDLRLTEDGFEYQLATNHLGHFYLTHLLLENLKKAGEQGKYSRIVNVASCAHYRTEINFEDINLKTCYNPTYGYGRSKLAQILSTRSLNLYLKSENLPINIYAAHPGIVATDMFYDSPTTKGKFEWMGRFFKSPEEGAITPLYCGISSKMENQSGAYVSNCGDGYTTSYTKNVEIQDRLVKVSCEMLKIKKFGQINTK